MNIESEEPITAVDAKQSLQKIDKEGLVYEQKICLDFLKKHVKTKVTNARKMVEELLKVGRLKPEHVVTIVNILPETKDEVNLIFAKERISLKEEEKNKIIEIVKKHS